MIYFLCFSVIFTMIFPILSIPVNVVGLVISRGKTKKAHALLLAFGLAIMAYMWVPDSTMDLYRHHQELGYLSDFDTRWLSVYIQSSLEPLHYLLKFVVAQTGNNNLLQFFVVLCGYFELFWMISDLADFKKVKKWVFVLLLIYAFSAVRFIDFASGLRFNFAIINLALGVYMMYFKKKKYLPYLFFLVSIGFHMSTLLMVVLILIFAKIKIFRKIKISTIVITILLLLIPGLIIFVLNNVFGMENSFMKIVNDMYGWYFVNSDGGPSALHSGWNLFFPLANMLFCAALALIDYKKSEASEYDSLVGYLSLSSLVLTLNAAIFMRYGFLIVMISLPILMDILQRKNAKKMRLTVVSIIALLTVAQLVRAAVQIDSAGLSVEIDRNLTNSVFYIMEQNK